MKRVVPLLIGCLLLAVLFWFFPLFHVVRLDELQAQSAREEFNAATFVESFWKNQLAPSLSSTPEAEAVMAAFQSDAASARSQYGRKVGVGRTTLFMVRGQGKVVGIDKKGVALALADDHTEPDVILHTGMIFDNTARDASGLLDASKFPNSQQFNDIAAEINRVIESQMITELKKHAAAGKTVRFVGCAQVPDSADQLRPLTVIPLEVTVE